MLAKLDSFWFWRRYWVRYSFPHNVAWWIAWHLPRRIVNLAAIRIWSAATTGPFSHETPSNVTIDVALRRWESGHGK